MASTQTIDILTRLDIDTAAPLFSRALASLDAAADRELDQAAIEPGLRELVRLRASQLNGCAYCVAQHTGDALAAGEPVGRVTAVSVWRESPFFTARERAALALADTMTRVVDTHVPDADWREAAAHLPRRSSGRWWPSWSSSTRGTPSPSPPAPGPPPCSTHHRQREGVPMDAEISEEFDDFMRRREGASNNYIRGDARDLSAMLTHQDPATFMPPGGVVIEGAAAVESAQIAGAARFGPQSAGHFEVLSSGSSGDLAFWTGRQVATMELKGQDEPVPMVLRTTEVFRREDGRWKLVHRHADLSKPSKG